MDDRPRAVPDDLSLGRVHLRRGLSGVVFLDRFLLHPPEITNNASRNSREPPNPVYQEFLTVSRQLDHVEQGLPGT